VTIDTLDLAPQVLERALACGSVLELRDAASLHDAFLALTGHAT
jgi:hypothetical protein